MRTLTIEESEVIHGGTATGAFGLVGGLVGMYYGASFGALISAPFAFIGLVFALTANNGIIWGGVALSCALFGAGLFGGALIGGLFGAGVGTAGGMATDAVIKAAKE